MIVYVKSSCSPLPSPKLSRLLLHLALYGFAYALGDAETPKNPAHMPRSHTLFAGNLAEVRQPSGFIPESSYCRAKMGVQIDASLTVQKLKDSLVSVNANERKLFRAAAIGRIAPRIAELRANLDLTQSKLAEVCGVSAVQISRWEKKLDLPSPKALLAISRLAPDDEKGWWLSESGMESRREPFDDDRFREIPVLKDAAAAGTTRAVNENEVERTLVIPKEWLPAGGSVYGVKVEGDSMSPILESGYIAILNIASRDAKLLDGRMVAARDGDGITIKWLRKQSRDLYLLVPQHTSPRHQIQIMQPDGEWSIVGEVLKWIGEPPSPPKRK